MPRPTPTITAPPAPVIEVPEFLTVAEVADQLRVGKETVRRMIRREEIAAHRIGRSIRIDAASVGRYLASTATGPSTETRPVRPDDAA